MRSRLLLCALAAVTACGGEATGPGVATKLAFTVQPSSPWSTGVIAAAVRVAVQDAKGITVSTDTRNVTVAITPGTGTAAAVLGGTRTVAAVGGVATFDDLWVNAAGTGYRLTATASGLASATSAAFAVTGPLVPPPLAGLRYLNLVNDTGAVDFRIVNLVSYAPSASAASFRTGGSPYGVRTDTLPFHLAVVAGVAVHIRVFPNSTDPVVAAQILFDTTLVFAEKATYTFYLYGQARGSHIRALVTVDTLPSPAGAAYRVVNLGGPGVGASDVDMAARTAVAPLAGAATFANVADGAVTGYVGLGLDSAYQAIATAPGTRGPFRFFANIPAGTAGTPTVNPIGGSNVAGTGISAVIVPRPVLSSLAQTGCGTPAGCLASDTLPRFLFLIDRKPPPTAP